MSTEKPQEQPTAEEKDKPVLADDPPSGTLTLSFKGIKVYPS